MNTPDRKFIVRGRAIIVHDRKLLLVKHPHDTSFATLPGGHLEWGEDVRECLKREIREELGVEPVLGRLLYVNTFLNTSGVQPMEFFFEVQNAQEYLNTKILQGTHTHEIGEILWVGPEDDIKILPAVLGEDFRAGKILSDETRFIRG